MKTHKKIINLVAIVILGTFIGLSLNLVSYSEVQSEDLCGTCFSMSVSPYSFCNLVYPGGGCDAHHTGAPCWNNCGLSDPGEHP